MQKVKILSFLFVNFLSLSLLAQSPDPVIVEYINTYKEIAIAEMQRTGVPASIKLAQGIHETGAGQSVLVKKSNNHFGIKCKTGWSGQSVKHTDDAPNECFRKYDSPFESYIDHSDFLKRGQRYAFLFELDPLDYAGWAHGLKKAGYATNPKYPVIIIRLIEEYRLQDYTLIAMGKMKNEPFLANREEARPAILEKAEAKVNTVVSPVMNEPVMNTVTYPSGEFRLNDTRVIYVEKGTSFLSLAQQYNIPLNRLFDFNDMEAVDFATTGQLVYLQRKRKTGLDESYTARAGETAWEIAQKQGIRLDALVAYNNLDARKSPAAGQVLHLRPSSANTSVRGKK